MEIREGMRDWKTVSMLDSVCVRVLFSPAFFGPFNESLVERCILRNGLNDAVVCGHMTNSPMTHSCGAETEDVAMTKKKKQKKKSRSSYWIIGQVRAHQPFWN